MAKGKYEAWINDPDKLTLLAGWARKGLSDEQIAKNMGIRRSTLNEWRKKFPVISDALKKNKNITLLTVEKLCRILDCTPNEVVNFTEDS